MAKDVNIEWRAIIDALKTTHTLNTRDICQILKCNRKWVGDYVLPYLRDDMIHLPSGRGSSSKCKENWVWIAAMQLNRPDLTELNWYNTKKFEQLISNSISSVTRKTISVPVELFVSDKAGFKAQTEYLISSCKEMIGTFDGSDMSRVYEINKLNAARQKLWHQMIDPRYAHIVDEGERVYDDRSKIDDAVCNINVMPLMDRWVSLGDIVSYGDTEIEKYREFFRKGYLRIELGLLNAKGKKCRKVYYLKDPNPIEYKYVDQYVTLDYNIWEKYRDTLMKSA